MAIETILRFHTLSISLTCALRDAFFFHLMIGNQPVGDVVLVDVADILDRFTADFVDGNDVEFVRAGIPNCNLSRLFLSPLWSCNDHPLAMSV